MSSKKELLTQRIVLNGVSVLVRHPYKARLPKFVTTELRAVNNSNLKRLANQVIKF